MSPRKLTEDDKHEILTLYRNSEATTSTLASDYEVSSSTISRFLKNKLSSVEYEDLIQQKRLARTPRGEKTAEITTETSKKTTATKQAKAKSGPKKVSAKDKVTKTKTTKTTRKKSGKTAASIKSQQTTKEVPIQLEIEAEIPLEPKSEPQTNRRRRRRSSTADISNLETNVKVSPQPEQEELIEAIAEELPSRLIIDRQPGGNSGPVTDKLEESDLSKANSLILKADRVDLDEDDDENDDSDVDLVALKEMLGDDLEDFNDDLEDEDEWDEDEDEDIDFSPHDSTLHDIEILPLSQALMPKTCYLVIDRSAELIVKPLADFADLGDIPNEEIKQRTLPIFDNHRIAKRFSHRRERVIKVPDGRMIQKTSHHLENKGITRLLIDGQIYSLAH